MAIEIHINLWVDLRRILWTHWIVNISKTAIKFLPNIQISIDSVSNSEVISHCKDIDAVRKGTLRPK